MLPHGIAIANSGEYIAGKNSQHLAIKADDAVDEMILEQMVVEVAQVIRDVAVDRGSMMLSSMTRSRPSSVSGLFPATASGWLRWRAFSASTR